jgi:hypothetical protein
MGTKTEPGKYDCLSRAEDDEPFFVLLARDPSAPSLIADWVRQRQHQMRVGLVPNNDDERAKIEEARQLAKAMLAWRAEHRGGKRAAGSRATGSRP